MPLSRHLRFTNKKEAFPPFSFQREDFMEETIVLQETEADCTPPLDSREESVSKKPKADPFAPVFQFLDRHRRGLPLVLAFFLPALIFSVCLILLEVYPFGDSQIINYDGWHQYYPFLLQLWDHFHEGKSLLYDWSMGMGTNFLSMLSYYGSSPFYLFLYLVPVRDFRVLFTLFVVIRIGLAGLFTALFLRKLFPKAGYSIAFFGLGYALSGYMMGYYWNIMWLDTVALYPLVCLGTVKLFREGKSALYGISLALSLFCNYYIGFMSGVFTVLVFFALCLVDRVSLVGFFKKGFRLLLVTLLSAAMSAVILLPAFFGLLNTASTQDAMGVYASFYESVRDIIATLSSFHEPVYIDGLPNLSTCAMLVLFAFAFLWAKKIGFREKLVAFVLLVFLVFSMNFSVLNYIWHGFHFTNQIPYRFAYLFAFVIVVMAYSYYRNAISDFDWIDAVGMVIFAAALAFCAFGMYPDWSIIATVGVMAVSLILCAFFSAKIISRRGLSFVVCSVILIEMCASAYLGTQTVGVSGHSDYFDGKRGEEVMTLVEQVKEKEKGSQDFYRMETTEWRSLNDSCFYGYNGISQFSSSANRDVSAFLLGLGMPADPGSNRFVYSHGTPLSNLLLGVKYLIDKEGYISDRDFVSLTAPSNDFTAALYESRDFAGLGFLVDEKASEFSFDLSQNPFERQNALFRAITGLEGDLFSLITPGEGEHTGLEVTQNESGVYEFTLLPLEEGEEEERVLRFPYQMPRDSGVYIYADVPLANYTQVNNAWHCIEEYPTLFSGGTFKEGETFQLRTVIQEEAEEGSGTASFDVAILDGEIWEQGMELIHQGKMKITSFEDTRICATVTATEEKFLYTSIPAEAEGSWTVLVDGKKTEVVPFADAFVGVPLSSGEHTLEFTYRSLGFEKGCIFSVSGILLWVALWIAEKRGFVLFREKAPIAASAEKWEEIREKTTIEPEGEADDCSETDESDPQGD